MERSVLKSNAKSQLKGKWGIAVITFIVGAIIVSIFPLIAKCMESGGLAFILQILGILVAGAIVYGFANFSLNFANGNEVTLGDIFAGFSGKVYLKTLGIYILMGIAVGVGMIILVVPGIILAIMFSQSYYILCDDNDKSVIDCLKESANIMKGHKGEYFILCLSFIGWGILSAVTCGIAGLWVTPYVNVTMANYYCALVGKQADE